VTIRLFEAGSDQFQESYFHLLGTVDVRFREEPDTSHAFALGSGVLQMPQIGSRNTAL
jgi:hypothetical protein